MARKAPLVLTNGGLQQLQSADRLSSVFNLSEDSYVIVEPSTTDTGRATNLRAAYTAAAALTPGGNAKSAINRVTVFLPPGRYDLGTGDGTNHGLILNTAYVDLLGMAQTDETIVTSQIATASRGTIEQTVSDVMICNMTIANTNVTGSASGLDTDPCAYFPSTGLTNIRLRNVNLQVSNASNASAMRPNINYQFGYGERGGSVRVKCFVGTSRAPYAFGGGSSTSGGFSGVLEDCEGGDYSYGYRSSGGGMGGSASRCIGGKYCFYGTRNGTYPRGTGFARDCEADDYSFLRIRAVHKCKSTASTSTGSMSDCGVVELCDIQGQCQTTVDTVYRHTRIQHTDSLLQVDGTNTVKLLFCELLQTGGTYSVIPAGTSAVSVAMANCVLTKDIHPSVTNTIAAGWNTVDESAV